MSQLEQDLEDLKAQLAGGNPDRGVFRAEADGSNTVRKIYLFSQLPFDKTIALAKEGVIAWWLLLSAAAFAGDVPAMRKVHKAALEAKAQPDPANALAWVAEPIDAEGLSSKADAAVIRQLLEWKADPNADKGKWLEKSLRKRDADSIRALIDHGANPAIVFRVLGDLINNKNYAQAAVVQDALTKGELFIRIDDDTVMQTKFIPGPEGGSQLKAIFNFKSRRVNEIYESAGPQGRTTMTSVALDDYDSAAIDYAREQLKKLGGHPPDGGIDKPKRPGLTAG